VGLSALSYLLYVVGVAVLGRPGVFLVIMRPGALAIVFVLGPLAALAALQLAVCVSSRVNDARSAQQIGALVILPIAAILVAQLAGVLVLTPALVMALAVALALFNALLMLAGVWLFRRETILTRWK
jgi:ABC-2 type transport system permease protein